MLITGNSVTHSTQKSKVHLFSMTKNEPNRGNRKVIKRSTRFGQEAIKRPDCVWDSCALPCLDTCKIQQTISRSVAVESPCLRKAP